MKRLITICAVVGLIMAVTGTAQADLDIDAIFMTSCKDHLDDTPITDPWCFEVWIDFVDEGTLHHIDMTLPDSSTIYPLNSDNGDWYYDSPSDYSSLAGLRVDYPTGTYTFDFRDGDDGLLRSVPLDYNDLSEPTNPVDFTYPAHGATDVPLDPTFTWTVESDAGDALGMWVWDEVTDEDIYEDAPVAMDTLSWTPGPLLPGREYGLEVSVFRVKDVEVGPACPTTTVGGDKFAYCLLMEHLNEIEFTTVPEPATIALLSLGGLALLRKRKP